MVKPSDRFVADSELVELDDSALEGAAGGFSLRHAASRAREAGRAFAHKAGDFGRRVRRDALWSFGPHRY